MYFSGLASSSSLIDGFLIQTMPGIQGARSLSLGASRAGSSSRQQTLQYEVRSAVVVTRPLRAPAADLLSLCSQTIPSPGG
jgi:hypothetical protein